MKLAKLTFSLTLASITSGVYAAGNQAPVPPTNADILRNEMSQSSLNNFAPTPRNGKIILLEEGQPQSYNENVKIAFHTIQVQDLTAANFPVSKAAVTEITNRYLNRPISFNDVNKLTNELTKFYRQQGAVLARVMVPKQDFSKGQLDLILVPGKYQQDNPLNNRSHATDRTLQAVIDRNLPVGEVITDQNLNRLALLLNEVPAVESAITLHKGNEFGAAQIAIDSRDLKRFEGYIGIDDFGSSKNSDTTGHMRLLAGVAANELLGIGDQLRFDTAISLKDSLWDKSNVVWNGVLEYSVLANGYGTRIGARYQRLDYSYYEATNQQTNLYTGYSNGWQLYTTHPLIRQSDVRLNLRAGIGQTVSNDHYNGAMASTLAPKIIRRDTQGVLAIDGIVYTRINGQLAFSFGLDMGRLNHNDVPNALNGIENGEYGRKYNILNYQVQYEQPIAKHFTLFSKVRGQFSPQNVDSSHKLYLGGVNAVRGYDNGTGAATQGTIGTIELRSVWQPTIKQYKPQVTIAAFYDQAWGSQWEDNYNRKDGKRLADDNHFKLAAAGAYVAVALPSNFSLNLTYAKGLSGNDPVSNTNGHSRWWFSVLKSF